MMNTVRIFKRRTDGKNEFFSMNLNNEHGEAKMWERMSERNDVSSILILIWTTMSTFRVLKHNSERPCWDFLYLIFLKCAFRCGLALYAVYNASGVSIQYADIVNIGEYQYHQ